jgi:hypothetical protein
MQWFGGRTFLTVDENPRVRIPSCAMMVCCSSVVEREAVNFWVGGSNPSSVDLREVIRGNMKAEKLVMTLRRILNDGYWKDRDYEVITEYITEVVRDMDVDECKADLHGHVTDAHLDWEKRS